MATMHTHTPKQAFAVKEFLAAYGIGRTKFYEEVKAGRLKTRKVGKRTLITRSDADAWLNNLPVAA